MVSQFSIAWESGPAAQLEFFSPTQDNGRLRLKFTPSFRKTIRPPITTLDSTLEMLSDRILPMMDKVATDAVQRRRLVAPPIADAQINPAELIEKIGLDMRDLMIPWQVESELSQDEPFYLEVGADERLSLYPWELLFDSKLQYCFRHMFGRFVNATQAHEAPATRPGKWEKGPLRVLLVSVPQPAPRKPGAPSFAPLPGAEKEVSSIIDTLTPLGDALHLHALEGPAATFDAVKDAFRERWHIIHFVGHAYFDPENPTRSALVLHDEDLRSAWISQILAKSPPLLAFLNGCETVKMALESRYDLLGFARAFLDAGAYLLGNRWPVGDEAGAAFAKKFYEELIQGKPLGSVICAARKEAKTQVPTDESSWASYIYYGDPRLSFKPEP